MRRALAGLAALALALPLAAAAAGLDPSALVLQRADVPAGFRVDRAQTGLRTNAREAQFGPQLPALFRRWGRLTGYQVEFDRDGQTIASRVDVFRSASGAAEFLVWYEREARKGGGLSGLRRSRLALGDGGWLYRSPLRAPFAVAIWREGRVFAGAVVSGLPPERLLGLARAQQRRIEAELR